MWASRRSPPRYSKDKAMKKSTPADKTPKPADRIGKILSVMYVLFLLASFAVIGRIIYIQAIWKPDEKLVKAVRPRTVKSTIVPERGAILASDGRILAMTLPVYDLHMDCTVLKERYAKMTNRQKGDSLENEWRGKARALADGLARELGKKSSSDYYEMIRSGRDAGRKYVSICDGIERRQFNRLQELPLFNEPQYRGGLIVTERSVRRYPYGELARRTIGFVRSNTDASANTHIGVEGKFNSYLHGTDGVEFLRVTDGRVRVHDNDSTYIKSEDGCDVRTTLDIDLQDIADAALRTHMADDQRLVGGCAVVMDVESGAIRAMVNLTRDTVSGKYEEYQNFAIGRLGEPGSVFKATTLMTVVEDGKIRSLDDTIPTHGGRIRGYPDDPHVFDYEREHKTRVIPVIDGFEMSSNYVFRYLAVTNYGGKPKEFIDRLYSYKLGEAYDFDIDGFKSAVLPSQETLKNDRTALGATAIGYSVMETPMHILTFYNAIANKGRMMKPYIVEDIEKYGDVVAKRGPSVLNASICSKATADTLTRALRAVTEEGTAKKLKGAAYHVAGKTGTARVALDNGRYENDRGEHMNQGTFVGFFPAESPKYSVIVTVYSGLMRGATYGGDVPAATVREIVDKIYAMTPRAMAPVPQTQEDDVK